MSQKIKRIIIYKLQADKLAQFEAIRRPYDMNVARLCLGCIAGSQGSAQPHPS